MSSVSFHLNEQDAQALRGVANAHGAKSGLVKYAVKNCVTIDDKLVTAASILTGQPTGPFNQKFNVVGGKWSETAQEVADSLGVKRAEVIRFAVHNYLVVSGFVTENQDV